MNYSVLLTALCKGLVSRNKILEEENIVLRTLIGEEANKTADERRILILKCQIYQLEKQVDNCISNLSFIVFLSVRPSGTELFCRTEPYCFRKKSSVPEKVDARTALKDLRLDLTLKNFQVSTVLVL